MSSSQTWKQNAAGKGLKDIVLDSIVTNTLLVKTDFIVQNFTVGNISVNNNLDISLNLFARGNIHGNNNLYITNNISLNGNFLAQNAYVNNKLFFGTNVVDDGTYSYLYGNSIAGHIGVNTTSPTSVFDILDGGMGGEMSNVLGDVLTVRTSSTSIRNVIAQNNTFNAVTSYADTSYVSIGFFTHNDLSYSAIPSSSITASGNYITVSGKNVRLSSRDTTWISSKLIISPYVASAAYAATVTVTDYSGNAMSLVSRDGSSTTFLNIVTPNNNGFSIGGGAGGAGRSVGTFGVKDTCGNYVNTQTIVSGTNKTHYRSTTGFNTAYPITERFVVDINGPVLIRNGEITQVLQTGYPIDCVNFMKGNSNVGISIGGAAGLDPDASFSYYLSTTLDGGRSWTSARFQHGGIIERAQSIKYALQGFVYDQSNIFISSASGGLLYYSNNGGTNWLTYNDVSKNHVFNTVYSGGAGAVSYFVVGGSNGGGSISGKIFINNTDLSLVGIMTSDATKDISYNVIDSSLNNITACDGSLSILYFVGSNGIEKYDVSKYSTSLNHGLLNYRIAVVGDVSHNYNYKSVCAFDASHIVAVGDNIISYSNDGLVTWTDASVNASVVLNSVYIYDLSNAIAMGNNKMVLYSCDGYRTWNSLPADVSNSLLSIMNRIDTAGQIIMPNKNAILFTGVGAGVGSAGIFYGFYPSLFNSHFNNVFDICGNMEITGDVLISGNGKISTTNTTFSLLNENVKTLNIGNSTDTLVLGSSSTQISLPGTLDFIGDVSLNSHLFVGDDVSMNSRLFVKGDLSLNGNLRVGGSFTYKNLTATNNLNVTGDVSMTSRLFVGADVSLNGNFSVNNKLMVDNSGIFVTGNLVSTMTATVNNLKIIDTSSIAVSSLSGSLMIYNQNYPASVIFGGGGSGRSTSNRFSNYGFIAFYNDVSTNSPIPDCCSNNIYTNYNYFSGVGGIRGASGMGGVDVSSSALVIGSRRSVYSGQVIIQPSSALILDAASYGFPVTVFGATIIQPRGGAVGIGNIVPRNALDISGVMTVSSDVSLNARLFVGGDASLNKGLIVGGDVSFNRNLTVRGDVYANRIIGDVVDRSYTIEDIVSVSNIRSPRNLIYSNSNSAAYYTLQVNSGAIGIFDARSSPQSYDSGYYASTNYGTYNKLSCTYGGSLMLNNYYYPSITFNTGTTYKNQKYGFISLFTNINTPISFQAGFNFTYNYLNTPLNSNIPALVLSSRGDYTGSVSSYIILQPSSVLILDAANYDNNSVMPVYGTTIIQPRGGKVAIGKSVPGFTLDVSGTLAVSSSVFIGGDLSLNGKINYNSDVIFTQDVSCGGILHVGNIDNGTNGIINIGNSSGNNDVAIYGNLELGGSAGVKLNYNNELSMIISNNTKIPHVSNNTGVIIAHTDPASGFLNVIFENRKKVDGINNVYSFGFLSFYDNIIPSISTNSIIPLSSTSNYNYLNRNSSYTNMSAMIIGSRYKRDVIIEEEVVSVFTGSYGSLDGENYVIIQPDAVIVLDAACYSNITPIYGTTLIQPRGGSVCIGKTVGLANITLDISGNLNVSSNVYISNIVVSGVTQFTGSVLANNQKITGSLVVGSSTFVAQRTLDVRGNIAVSQDVIVGGRLFVDTSYALFSGQVYVTGDVSMSGQNYMNKLYAVGDSSFGGQVSFDGPVRFNGDTIFDGQVFTNNGITMKNATVTDTLTVKTLNIINNFNNVTPQQIVGDIVTRYKLFVTSDASLGKRLFVGGDVSFSRQVYVVGDTVLGGRLLVGDNDVSLNGKLLVGKDASFRARVFILNDASFGSNVSVAGDVSFAKQVFISGKTVLNGNVEFGKDISLNNRLFVGNDASFGGRVYIGGNALMNGQSVFGGDVLVGGGGGGGGGGVGPVVYPKY